MKKTITTSKNSISIIIPCRDEEDTVISTLKRVKQSLERFGGGQIIIIDDFSTDSTLELLQSSPGLYTILIKHKESFGKGAAICTALRKVTGDIVLIQDADNEYFPEDYPILFEQIFNRKAEVVYGVRPFKEGPWFRSFVVEPTLRFYSLLLRKFTSLHVKDIATCYKAFRSELLKSLDFKEQGFCWDLEVTIKLAQVKDLKYAEVPVRYSPRTKAEGKKLSLWVGVRYFWLLLKLGLVIKLRKFKRIKQERNQ